MNSLLEEREKLISESVFGENYSKSEAKYVRKTLRSGECIAPRYNRRGTEFLGIAKGTANVNGKEITEGEIIRVDTGEIIEISSENGCDIVSHIFPYNKYFANVPYEIVPDTKLSKKFNNKKVSIVIIAKDIQYHICHAIISCLTQTYPNLQILVIDDASDDETGHRADSMASFDPRIEVHHVDLGMNGARRFGLEHAEGDFCVMIDGDDWLSCDAIEKLLQTAQDLDSELVLFGFDHYNDKTREVWNPIYPSYSPKTEILLPKPVKDKDARETARLNHTVWMNFFSTKLRPIALKAMRHIYQYEDLPFSLSLMQHAKNPALCNLILYHYRRERVGQSTEKWWKVLPSQKQACLKISVKHALEQFEENADYYRLIFLYKIDQIINYELGMPQSSEEAHAWRNMFSELFSLFPPRLHDRLVEEGIKYEFRKAHSSK